MPATVQALMRRPVGGDTASSCNGSGDDDSEDEEGERGMLLSAHVMGPDTLRPLDAGNRNGGGTGVGCGGVCGPCPCVPSFCLGAFVVLFVSSVGSAGTTTTTKNKPPPNVAIADTDHFREPAKNGEDAAARQDFV